MIIFSTTGSSLRSEGCDNNVVQLPVTKPDPGPKRIISVVIGKPERLDDLTHLWTGAGSAKINDWKTLDKPPFPKSDMWTPGDWLRTIAGEEIMRTASKSRIREALLIDEDISYLDVVGLNLALGLARTPIRMRQSAYEKVFQSDQSPATSADGWARLPQGRKSGRRIVDMIAGICLLIAALPLIPIAAVALKASSPGPVLVREQCAGLHGRIFTTWKLRTRTQTISRTPENVVLLQEDTEIQTPGDSNFIGAFLRKTCLDRAPQIWNVLQGDMQLSGGAAVTRAHALKLNKNELDTLKRQPGLFRVRSPREA